MWDLLLHSSHSGGSNCLIPQLSLNSLWLMAFSASHRSLQYLPHIYTPHSTASAVVLSKSFCPSPAAEASLRKALKDVWLHSSSSLQKNISTLQHSYHSGQTSLLLLGWLREPISFFSCLLYKLPFCSFGILPSSPKRRQGLRPLTFSVCTPCLLSRSAPLFVILKRTTVLYLSSTVPFFLLR